MSAELQEAFRQVLSRLNIIKRAADTEGMESALVVFLPDGKRFNVRKLGIQEPYFFLFIGVEEHTDTDGLLLIPYGQAQFLFELRKSQSNKLKQKPGFVDTDGLVDVRDESE